jgi:hypothetical protein
MIKKVVLSLSVLCSVAAAAQESTGSPYSVYGIGDQKFKGSNEHKAMSGLSVIGDSIHLNLSNPASYADLGVTTFSVGASHTNYKLQALTESEKTKRTSLDYLAVGLPIGKKAGVSFGLMPYTNVGYRIQSSGSFEELNQSMQYSGDGGLNKVYLGLGYKLFKGFSLGADAQYYFGKIENKTLLATQGVQYISRSVNETNNRGLAFNFGAMYQFKVKDFDIHSSITYAPQTNLNVSTDRKISTISLSASGNELTVEERNVDVSDSKFKLPAAYSFGTSFGKLKNWMIGAQVSFADAKQADFNLPNIVYDNSSKYVLGGYYIPKYNSFTSYFSRVTYRAGLRYEQTGMVINNQKIDDKAITAGVGLPLGSIFSNLNIGLEYGQRGTKSAGLIKENYFSINLGFSFNDRWFQKTKYY